MTAGDPSGVGPEVTVKAIARLAAGAGKDWSDLRRAWRSGALRLEAVGRPGQLAKEGRRHAPALPWGPAGLARPVVPFHAALPGPERPLPTGVVHRASGAAALAALRFAADGMKAHRWDGVVTAPVHKESIHRSLPGFIGHTEFFAEAAGVKRVSMCFFSPDFDLVLVTTHVGIRRLPDLITPEALRRALRDALAVQALRGDRRPLAVLGLNPHAGENGLFGGEDALIARTAAAFRRKGFAVDGPLAADSAFVDVRKGRWRTVVACYHDQGLIPLKMLSKGRSVNVTLGLPWVRTSVDHGTAFDIAGKGRADEGSMLAAIDAAWRLVLARRKAHA